jgi:ribosomal protein S18 acetylase RimI-like enzyme
MHEPGPDGAAFRSLGPGDLDAILDLFASILEDPERKAFRPHGFGHADAARIARYDGRDLYAGGFVGSRLVAYGMLRGWDEGFEIPSLGLYVRSDQRGRGTGRWMLERLHAHAAGRGAHSVRLTVDRDNDRAIRLYEAIGYSFRALDPDRLVGVLPLGRPDPPCPR